MYNIQLFLYVQYSIVPVCTISPHGWSRSVMESVLKIDGYENDMGRYVCRSQNSPEYVVSHVIFMPF